jgi:hypothetical protein
MHDHHSKVGAAGGGAGGGGKPDTERTGEPLPWFHRIAALISVKEMKMDTPGIHDGAVLSLRHPNVHVRETAFEVVYQLQFTGRNTVVALVNNIQPSSLVEEYERVGLDAEGDAVTVKGGGGGGGDNSTSPPTAAASSGGGGGGASGGGGVGQSVQDILKAKEGAKKGRAVDMLLGLFDIDFAGSKGHLCSLMLNWLQVHGRSPSPLSLSSSLRLSPSLRLSLCLPYSSQLTPSHSSSSSAVVCNRVITRTSA